MKNGIIALGDKRLGQLQPAMKKDELLKLFAEHKGQDLSMVAGRRDTDYREADM